MKVCVVFDSYEGEIIGVWKNKRAAVKDLKSQFADNPPGEGFDVRDEFSFETHTVNK